MTPDRSSRIAALLLQAWDAFLAEARRATLYQRAEQLRAKAAECRELAAEVEREGQAECIACDIEAAARARLAEETARADRAERVVKAARLFRKADTGGCFNDRVETGALLDDTLATYDRAAGGRLEG